MSPKGAPGRRPSAEPLARDLSGIGVWMLVINGIVGAGIFGLPGEAARLAGGFSPWVFLGCALLMLPVMLSFAELSSRHDETGGPVRYTAEVYGPLAGFLTGWALYLGRMTAFAANAVVLVGAIGYFWPAADAPSMRLALLFAVCALLTGITLVGTRRAIGSLGILTVLKFVPLVGLVAWGLAQVPQQMAAGLRVAPPPGADLGAAVLLVFYAYVGFESGLVPAGEARNARRDMPRALLWSIALAAVLYASLQLVCLAVQPELGSLQRPLVEVAAVVLGPAGAMLMTAGMVASIGGNLSGSLFSAPRITYALARDGWLPRPFARVSARYGTPAVSIVVFGAAAFALAAAGSFVWLAGLSVLARTLIYLACVSTLPLLHRRERDAPRGDAWRLPGGPVIPVVAMIVCVGLLGRVHGRDWVATAAMLGVGVLLYAIAAPSRRGPGETRGG
jgi:amino acid transporter